MTTISATDVHHASTDSPGSHGSTLHETGEELHLADGNPAKIDMHAAEGEVIVPLTCESTLVWKPATWHTTIVNGRGRRRLVGWKYSVAVPTRNAEAVRFVFGDEVKQWDEVRQRLWGVFDDNTEAKL